ncbi:MAG: hypothetical protein O2856_07380 [Planctomycetota bacterium]|nr:hypothetical protein [Planctomycetota bacterium]
MASSGRSTFSFELSNFDLRLIQFGLQFCVPLDCVGMPAFPVTNLAPQSIHLLTQLGIFTPQFSILSTQLPNVTTQHLHQGPE